ncbi:MAG: hypothetical protein LBV01_03680, partial [Deltaproteobacteria bacterium]|nr:hypothetical protein [Deltaproteobacteria bacterium]
MTQITGGRAVYTALQDTVRRLDDKAALKVGDGPDGGARVEAGGRSVHWYTGSGRAASIRAENAATAQAVRNGLMSEFGALRGKSLFNKLAGQSALKGDRPIRAGSLKTLLREEFARQAGWRADVERLSPPDRGLETLLLKNYQLCDRAGAFLNAGVFSPEELDDALTDGNALLRDMQEQAGSLFRAAENLRDREDESASGIINALEADTFGAAMAQMSVRLQVLREQRGRMPTDVRAYQAGVELQFQAALATVDKLMARLPPAAGADAARLRETREFLTKFGQARIGTLGRWTELAPGEIKGIMRQVTKVIAATLKDAVGRGIRFLPENGRGEAVRLTGKDAQKLFKASVEEGITAAGRWFPVARNLAVVDPDGLQHALTSVITPAAHMGASFSAGYHGKGVSSLCTAEAGHAVNLARTTLRDAQGGLLFQGVRHGVHSAFGLSAGEERRAANLVRARETLTAIAQGAVDANPALLAPGAAVDLPVVSLSLLTPDSLRRGAGDEAVFLREQTAAWRRLAAENNGQIQLTVMDTHGAAHQITVRPQLALFNFPVNAGAQGSRFVQGLVGGHFTSWRMNAAAFEQLFGREFMAGRGLPDGLVGARLGALSPAQREQALTLARQSRDIWNAGDQRKSGEDPYRLPARLAVLTSLLGAPPAFNCKSGKDRTGQMDVECKTLALETSLGRIPVPGSGEHTAFLRHLRSEMAVNSGNLEIQIMNTGLPGFKTQGVAGLDSTAESAAALTAQRGFSGAVK